jgi:hypothetical protein
MRGKTTLGSLNYWKF